MQEQGYCRYPACQNDDECIYEGCEAVLRRSEQSDSDEPLVVMPERVIRQEKPERSKCCAAPLRVESADEGTSHYICPECGQPSDRLPASKQTVRQPDEELVKGMRELGFVVGRNPDGVDDSVAATLLIVRGLKEARERQPVPVTEEMVERAIGGWRKFQSAGYLVDFPGKMRAALRAALNGAKDEYPEGSGPYGF
jgi:hypothetical protein